MKTKLMSLVFALGLFSTSASGYSFEDLTRYWGQYSDISAACWQVTQNPNIDNVSCCATALNKAGILSQIGVGDFCNSACNRLTCYSADVMGYCKSICCVYDYKKIAACVGDPTFATCQSHWTHYDDDHCSKVEAAAKLEMDAAKKK